MDFDLSPHDIKLHHHGSAKRDSNRDSTHSCSRDQNATAWDHTKFVLQLKLGTEAKLRRIIVNSFIRHQKFSSQIRF